MQFFNWEQGKENIKTFLLNIVIMVSLVLMLFPETTFAAGASVKFDETSYTVGKGEELVVLMSIQADDTIGLYNVQVQYDTSALTYERGGENESGGIITLKGTGYSKEVTYRLRFTAKENAKAGIFVKNASILAQENDEKFVMEDNAYASITVGNPEVNAKDFKDTYLQAQNAKAVENFTYDSDIPVIGAVRVDDSKMYYFVDLKEYKPEVALWDYKNVVRNYGGNELTFLTDQNENVTVAVLVDTYENFVTYAVKDGTQEFYPITTRFIRGEEYHIMSIAACTSIPEDIPQEAIANNSVFYAIDSAGNGGIYQFSQNDGLVAWGEKGANASQDGLSGLLGTDFFSTRNIAIGGAILIGILLIIVLIVYKKTSRGSYDIEQYWFVVRELTGREIKRKYARSVLGIVWSVLNPLLYMGVMSLIFSTMFRSSIENFPVYYLIAYMFWTLFSTATNTALTAIVDNKNLVQKTKLPREIFILSRDYTALVNFGFSCIAFVLMLLVFRIRLHWSALLFPVILLFAFLFSTGISFMLAAIYVFQRDVKFVYKNLMPLLNHLIAMFYPIDILTPDIRRMVEWNPIYSYIKAGRDCMLYGNFPETSVILQMVIWGVATFFLGLLVFKAKENRIIQKL